MTFVFLFVLAVAWTVYGAMVWRSRVEHRNVNSISSFSRHLNVLERTSPNRSGFDTVQVRAARATLDTDGYIVPPAVGGTLSTSPVTLRQAQRRRRDLLAGLGAVSLLSVLLGGLVGGFFVFVAVASVALFGAYVALLARSQQIAAERDEKVRYLPASGASAAEPAYLLEAEPTYLRSAN